MMMMKKTTSSTVISNFLMIIAAASLISTSSVLKFVNSQSSSSDSCTSNLNQQLNNIQLLFDTANLICRPVWTSQDFILRYEQTTPSLWSFVVSAPNTNSYIGMGFSSNGMMVGSSAVVGWITASGGGMMKEYHLTGQTPSKVVPDEGNLQLVGNTSSIVLVSSRIYMAFQLSTTKPDNRILYAVGPAGTLPLSPGYSLTEHDQKVSTTFNFASGESKTRRSYSNLKKSHGILNMLGWGILLVIGSMAARYMKPWDPIWFYSHALFQSLGFIFGVVGIICGFVLEDRVSRNVDRHKGLGIFILVLGCLQVLAVLVRPDKDAKGRKYWNWYHHAVGRALLLVAVVNVFYGIHLGDAGTSWNAAYGILLSLFVIAAFVLEMRLIFAKK